MVYVEEIRRVNLERLAKKYGTYAALAAALGKSPAQLSQWASRSTDPKTGKKRVMSRQTAREIELTLALEHGWMDQPETISVGTSVETAEDGRNNAELGGRPRYFRRVPVTGTARMGDGGFYEELEHPEGFLDAYSGDLDAFALRVKGDSMHPAIRHGMFVIVEPSGRCTPGEYVAIELCDGQRMVKELVIERADEVVIESVNGNQRQTLARADIVGMLPVGGVMPASKFRSV